MNKKRLLIAATNSGIGKTTTVCALIKVLQNQNELVSSFKCGPDYIDPMFHNVVLHSKCTNLDLFLMQEDTIKHLINENTKNDELAIIEGVMGYYDGIGGTTMQGSACDIALKTKTPTILVVNGSGVSVSLLAMIKGYLEFADNTIKGVIINNISDSFYPTIKKEIEDKLNIQVFGYLRHQPQISIDSRYLGLLQPDELEDIDKRMQLLANSAKETLDLDAILKMASEVEKLEDNFEYPTYQTAVKIGVVKDQAFNFLYKDNLKVLEKYGAKLEYISLLDDEKLSDDLDGLIIPGGYPELFIEKLSNNTSMLESVKQAASNGLVIVAESGGFIYLGSDYEVDNQKYPLANVIQMHSQVSTKLQPFGYVTNETLVDNVYTNKTEKIAAHEFHYATSDLKFNAMHAYKENRQRNWLSNYANENILAGFSHFHYYSNLNIAINFLKKCSEYQEKRLKNE